jgi:hypothetical protein
MMQRAVTLCMKNTGSINYAINNSGESIKNREYLLEFEAKVEKSLNTEQGAWEESICAKSKTKNLIGLSRLYVITAVCENWKNFLYSTLCK